MILVFDQYFKSYFNKIGSCDLDINVNYNLYYI